MAVNVAILRCKDYETRLVEGRVRQLLHLLGGIERFVSAGDRVLLKPNLLATKTREEAVNTDPAVVRAVAKLVLEAGATPIIGDSPGVGSAKRNAGRCGIGAVASELGIPVVEFNESVPLERKGRFPLELAGEALGADRIINLPKLKTHGQMLMTLGVKNMFGCVIGKRKVQWHFKAGVNRQAFARMLVEIYQALSPQLTLIDGIVGMEGNGPSSGSPVSLGLLGASSDAVALDAVVMHLIGLDPARLPTVVQAREMGIGETDLKAISLLGDPVENLPGQALRLPESADLEWGLPNFLLAPLKNSLTAFPLPDRQACTLCQVCLEACPQHALKIEKGSLTVDTRNCIRCFCCQELCPQNAMKTRQGWLLKLLKNKSS
ncbi:MAG: DUF362 domain-containing protein [bacterium]|nr:DUF362 domain-containing protein [bacterium]